MATESGQGQQRYFHDNGQLEMLVELVDGQESGDLIRLDREGWVVSRTTYSTGHIVQRSQLIHDIPFDAERPTRPAHLTKKTGPLRVRAGLLSRYLHPEGAQPFEIAPDMDAQNPSDPAIRPFAQDLHIGNSPAGRRNAFTPLNAPYVGMYVCGPTVYSNVHLGNVRTFLTFDVIFRYPSTSDTRSATCGTSRTSVT